MDKAPSERKLAAILYADIVGYTALMQRGEQHALELLERFTKITNTKASWYNGDIIKTYGDSVLITFSSAVDAVRCGHDIQIDLQHSPKVPLRIGIHVGEVVKKDNDLFGDPVNIASRVESMGVAGSVLLSADAYDKISNQESLKTKSLGTYVLKNVKEPMEVYALCNDGIVVPFKSQMDGKFKEKKLESTSKKSILVFEDEQLAAERIQRLLKEYYNNEINITWIQSVAEGITYLHNNTPDLILSDIELLDGRAFKVFEQTEIKAPIIFTTAYDQFLLEAFKTNGIAYLLKPIADDQLIDALDKYEKMFETKKEYILQPTVIQDLKQALDQSKTSYRRRFTIKKSSGIFILNVDDITHFSADDNIVFGIDSNNKKHIVNHRMSELEEILDPTVFFRINRSEIVNINYIEKMESYFNNRLTITINGVKEALKTSGPKTSAFRKWIDEG